MADKPTMNLFGPDGLGTVYNEEIDLTVLYSDFNLPFTNDVGNIMVNWKGKTRAIAVQGAHAGIGFSGADTDAKINDWLQTYMYAWVNAPVVGSREYTDSFGNTYDVKPINFRWRRAFNDPSRIIYSLLMRVV